MVPEGWSVHPSLVPSPFPFSRLHSVELESGNGKGGDGTETMCTLGQDRRSIHAVTSLHARLMC